MYLARSSAIEGLQGFVAMLIAGPHLGQVDECCPGNSASDRRRRFGRGRTAGSGIGGSPARGGGLIVE